MHPKDISAISQMTGEVHLLPSINGDLIVPEGFSLFQAEFARDGADLIIQDPNGTALRLSDYFNGSPPADVLSHDGATLRGSVVEKLAGPLFPAQYAQTGGFDLSDAIGQVEVLTGAAFVQRTDGQTVELEIGTKVFQGDVVRTENGSTLGLTFADGTIFTLASGSRMVLDELIYDPQASDNSGVFNLVEGSFVFIAGQTAKTGGIEINTPAATMGIRGTTGKIDIQTINGISTVTVSLNPDPDSGLGAIELFDLEGNLITTITGTDTKWVITPPFTNQPPIEIEREAADITDDNILLSQAVAAFQSAIARVQNGQTFVEFAEGDGDGQTGSQEPEAEDDGLENAPPQQPEPLNEDGDPESNGELGIGNPELDGVDEPIEQPDAGPSDDDDASLTPDGTGTEFADAGAATTEFSDVSFQSIEDTPLTSQLPIISPSGQPVQVSLSRGAENGLVVLSSDGTFTYTPNANFEGTDTFVVSGVDESGTLQEAEVTVFVDPVNDAPTANLRSVSATSVEEGAETTAGAGSVGGTLTYVDVDEGDVQGSWSIAASDDNQSAFGTISIDPATGVWRYDLDQAAADALSEGDVFEETYLATVTDAEGATDVSTLTITVTGSNDSPEITADTQQIRAFLATGPRADEVAGATETVSGTLNYVDVDEGDVAATWSIRPDVGNETAFGEMAIDAVTGRWTYSLPPNANLPLSDGETAVEVFVAIVTDAEGASTEQPITITITGTNAAPTIVFSIEDVSATVVEDGFGSNSGTVGAPRLALEEDTGRARRLLDEDSQTFSARQDLTGGSPNATGTLRYVDADGEPGEATWSITPQSAALGVMTIDAVTGQWRYFLDQEAANSLREGDAVIETFLATVTDPFGGTATQVITITVQGANDEAQIATAPQELVGTVEEGGIATATGKLSFVDPDAAPGEVSLWSIAPDSASRGIMTIDAETGQWTYELDPELGETLAQGEPVTETFTASITDSFGAVATQTITLTLIGENDAPTFVTGTASLSKIEAGVTIDLSALGEDVDDGEDGSTLTYALIGEPSEGAATIEGLFLTFSTAGNFNDLSEGQSRDVDIDVLVTDAFGATVEGTVTVTVTGQNSAPIITSAITDARGEVTEAGTDDAGVPEIGGTLTYTDDDASTPISGRWTVDPTASALGSITIDQTSGAWLYVLDQAAADKLNVGDSITERFTATITDETGLKDTQEIAVIIGGTNDAPTLAATTETISNRDEAIRIDLAALGGDVDAEDDGSTLTYTLVSSESAASEDEAAALGGSFAIEGNELVFRPEGDFNFLSDGQSQNVTALIRATDSRGASVTQEITVTITGTFSDPVITSGPLAARGIVEEEGSGKAGIPKISGTLTYNDDDAATPTSGTWAIAPFVPVLGSISIDATTGKWTYTLDNPAADALDAGDIVEEVFTATITDVTGRSDSTQITITIRGSNDAPSLAAKTETIDKGVDGISFDLAALAADVDADDTPATFEFEVLTPPSDGDAYIEGSELFFTTGDDFADLGPEQSREVSIGVAVYDGSGAFDVSTIIVTVTGSNTSPNVLTGSVKTGTAREAGFGVTQPEAGPDASGTLLYADTDERAGFPATWTVATNTANPLGQMQINAQSGLWEYFLDHGRADGLREGATVQEGFTATITDEFGGTDTTQITITIIGTNDKPVINAETSKLAATATDESPASLSGQIFFDDPDAVVTPASWAISFDGEDGPEFGTMSINASGVWTYLIDAEAVEALSPEDDLTERFIATVTDEFGASDDIIVDIRIMGGSTAPIITSNTSAATGLLVENNESSSIPVTASGRLTYSDADEGSVPGEWSITTVPFDVSFEGDASLNPGQTSLGSIKINAETGVWEYKLLNDLSEFLNEGDNITENYVAKITDADGETDTEVVTITIKGTNDAPFVTQVLQLDYDLTSGPLSIDVSSIVTDYDDTELKLLEVIADEGGTALIDRMGTADLGDDRILYTPEPGFVGEEALTFKIADPGGKTVKGEVEIEVANAAPVVTDSSVTIDPDGTPLDPALTWTSLLNDTTGSTHYYTFVLGAGHLVWSAAAAAAAQTGGYLATVTSQGEQNLLAGLKGSSYAWLGGSDAAAEGAWRWATGPEAGTQFWQGDEDGTSIGGAYENWNNIEPNNLGGEDYLSMLPSGLWNDVPADVRPFYPIGYFIEHEGLANSTGSVAGNAQDPTGQPLSFAVVGSYLGFDMDSDGSWTLTSSDEVFAQFTDGTLDITYTVTDALGASTQATLELVLADRLNPPAASVSGAARIAISSETSSTQARVELLDTQENNEPLGQAEPDGTHNRLVIDADPSAPSGETERAVAIDLDAVFAAAPELLAGANVIDISNGQRNVMSIDADDLLLLIEGNPPDANEAIEINMDAFDSVTLEPSDDWTLAPSGENAVQLTGAGGDFAALGAFATLSFAVDETQSATG